MLSAENMQNKCMSVHFQLTVSLDLANCWFLLRFPPAVVFSSCMPKVKSVHTTLSCSYSTRLWAWVCWFKACVLGIGSRCEKGCIHSNCAILREQKVVLHQESLGPVWRSKTFSMCNSLCSVQRPGASRRLPLHCCLRYTVITRDVVCSTFRLQAPPTYTQTHSPRTHPVTPVWSRSAASERAVHVVTSPARLVVCSGWFSLYSLFLLARLDVPSGEHNLCAYEMINRRAATFADCC